LQIGERACGVQQDGLEPGVAKEVVSDKFDEYCFAHFGVLSAVAE